MSIWHCHKNIMLGSQNGPLKETCHSSLTLISKIVSEFFGFGRGCAAQASKPLVPYPFLSVIIVKKGTHF